LFKIHIVYKVNNFYVKVRTHNFTDRHGDVMPASKESILTHLRRQIITLELVPGAMLDEAALCAEFEISRTPMREILRRLDGEGFVRVRENRGVIVAPMDLGSMRQFFMTAPMIYAAISRLAAQNAQPDQLDRLAEIQRAFKGAVSSASVEQMVYYNDQFHYQIGEMADNAYLQPSFQRLLIDHARIGQTFWRTDKHISAHTPDKIDEACRHHDEMIAAFAAGDEELSVQLTLQHWELSRADIETYIHPDPLALDSLMTG